MNADELLDYTLGQLEGPPGEAAEAAIAADPALLDRARRLESALDRLLDDGRDFEPPAGLAGRTIRFVAERKSKRPILDFVPVRVPFRWADVAVAAGILLASLLTLVPAIRSTQDKSRQARCSFNLQELGSSLANYAARHEHYPKVLDASLVGDYALALSGDSLLRDPQALHCPCRGDCPKVGPLPNGGHIDYAYHVGYRGEPTGQPEPVSPWLSTTVPLLADEPPHDATGGTILSGNSPNHGSRGQNVLFSDLHVKWFDSRRISPRDHDLFLNDNQRPEPGVNVHDAALVPAGFRLHCP